MLRLGFLSFGLKEMFFIMQFENRNITGEMGIEIVFFNLE